MTGATGIIGFWLVKELLDLGAVLVVLVRDADPQTELYRSDLVRRTTVVSGSLEDFWTLERAVNQHEIDTVFHLGAQTLVGVAHRFPLSTFETNIRGTWNVLEACRLHRDLVKRVVVASSDKAYGTQDNLPYVEEMPLQGQHPYEISKSCADLIAQSYFRSYQLPVAVVRCGNIYGGGDLNWSRIVPGTIRSLLFEEQPVLRSDGNFIRDYIYVKDVVTALLSLVEQLQSKELAGQAFNFSSESWVTVRQIFDRISKLMEKEVEPTILDCAVGEIRSQYLSISKAKEQLNWRPRYQLEQGLKETIEWYREFFAKSGNERYSTGS